MNTGLPALVPVEHTPDPASLHFLSRHMAFRLTSQSWTFTVKALQLPGWVA